MTSGVVLSNLMYPVVAVVVAAIAALIVVARHRRPKSIEANMRTFHRGLRALAPEDAEAGRVQPTPIRVRVHPRSASDDASAVGGPSPEHSEEAGSSAPNPEAETG